MGHAKRRGTFEERKDQAIALREAQHEARMAALAESAPMREAAAKFLGTLSNEAKMKLVMMAANRA